MAGSLILVANPGSASRKYALYEGETERAVIHFESIDGRIVCNLKQAESSQAVGIDMPNLQSAVNSVNAILHAAQVLEEGEKITAIGIRVVAPGGYFQEDHLVDANFMKQLRKAASAAPLHIAATLQEITDLKKVFPNIPIITVSDSAFHANKPEKARYYGIDLHDADKFDIQRFGYHGISLASVAQTLQASEVSAERVIVCHLGGGASVTALRGGVALDTTMGYSPLEGLIMSTRSGSIDVVAALQIKRLHGFNDSQLDDYLHHASGLLGLGGSADIRDLLAREHQKDERATFALEVYIYTIQKAIGQMSAVLGGVDALVFTGTIGERSAQVREKVTAQLEFLYFRLDPHKNSTTYEPRDVMNIAEAHSQPILVVGANEAREIARRASDVFKRE